VFVSQNATVANILLLLLLHNHNHDTSKNKMTLQIMREVNQYIFSDESAHQERNHGFFSALFYITVIVIN
jgi:hypothetical protein